MALSNMSKVTYNFLGPSGLKVSNLCLGTMIFGSSKAGRPSCSEKESHAILDRFVELGGNFIDTADVYQTGQSETIVGRWLAKQDRSRLVIATKFGRTMDRSDPNGEGCSRKHIMRSIENSLQRLQTSYVDLYYVHFGDIGTPLDETLSALDDLVHSGKVHYLAMSNAKGWQMQKIIEMSRYRGFSKFLCVQQQYSLLCRSAELELVDICHNEGIGIVPWSPLKGGWLSGRMKRDQPPGTDSRVGWAGAGPGRAQHSHPDWAWLADNAQVWQVLDTAQEIADKHGCSVPQVALRWLLQKSYVPSVVIGARTMEQLEDNMAAAGGWSLTPGEMDQLDSVSSVAAPYPYDEYLTKANYKRHRP